MTHPDCFDFWKYNRTEGNPDLGHYQMLPYGHGESYAQDVGYNVFNPAPTYGGMAPQSGYSSMPAPPTQSYGAPQNVQQAPTFAPTHVPPQPTLAPQPAPSQAPGPQAYRGMTRGPIQQASGVRGVPRSTGVRPANYR